jgi:hypothetical protein
VSDVSKWSFTTWRPLAADPFGNMDAIWYPRVQVDPLLTSLFQRIEAAEKERDEVRMALGDMVGMFAPGQSVNDYAFRTVLARARRALARTEGGKP